MCGGCSRDEKKEGKVLQIWIGGHKTHPKANNKQLQSCANPVPPTEPVAPGQVSTGQQEILVPCLHFIIIIFYFFQILWWRSTCHGDDHNPSDLVKKYSEIYLYKYSCQNKHIYNISFALCLWFTNVDPKKISASSSSSQGSYEVRAGRRLKLKLHWQKNKCACCFVCLAKDSTSFSGSVTVFSSSWDSMGCGQKLSARRCSQQLEAEVCRLKHVNTSDSLTFTAAATLLTPLQLSVTVPGHARDARL